MTTKTLTIAALAIATLPTLGFAQAALQRPQPPVLDFAVADADASGGISAEEWTAYAGGIAASMRSEMLGARADALIAAADADGDGVLTRDEVIAGYTALGEERREARGERRGMMGRMMDRMRGEHGHGMQDGDHERGGRHEDRQARGHGHGDRDGHGMRGHGRDSGDRMGRMGDGPRSAEPGERLARAFERMDMDGNGQIDAEELAAAQTFMQRRAQRMGDN